MERQCVKISSADLPFEYHNYDLKWENHFRGILINIQLKHGFNWMDKLQAIETVL